MATEAEANGVSNSSSTSQSKLRKFNAFGEPESDSEKTPLILGSSSSPPSDVCALTYIIFCLHGVGHLLPWNFFITAKSYFEHKFTCPSANGTDTSCSDHGLGSEFENYFSVAAMLPIFIMTGANIWLQSKIHYKYRMIFSLLSMLLLFIVTTAFVGVSTQHWIEGFFALTIVTVMLINVSSAIFQSSSFGFAGVFPPKYISAIMSGQACAGIFAALAAIVTTAAGQGITDSTLGYFSSAVLFIILCLLTLGLMTQLKFVRYYLTHTSVESQKAKQKEAVRTAVNVKVVKQSPPFFQIFRSIWLYAVTVCLVFTVTLSQFPAILSQIKSVQSKPSDFTKNYFTGLVCFLLFNCSDFVGRYITHWITVGKNRFVLFVCALLRLGFIPLFLLCNVTVEGQRAFPVPFKSDVFPILFVTLFGLSNGYLGSVAMVTAPEMVLPAHRETASTIMVFFLSFGLLAGGTSSFFWTFLVKNGF